MINKELMDNKKTNNNQNGQILYASLLPLLIIIVIIAGAGFYLFKGEIKLPSFRKDITEIRRLDGFPTVVSYTSEDPLVEKQRLVIKNQEELNNFLNTVDPTGKLILKEDINFDKEFLIGVSTETKESYGYEMKVKKLFEDKEDNSLLVQAEETRPGDECDEDRVPNVSIDIVAISKTDRKIDIERIVNVIECEKEEL